MSGQGRNISKPDETEPAFLLVDIVAEGKPYLLPEDSIHTRQKTHRQTDRSIEDDIAQSLSRQIPQLDLPPDDKADSLLRSSPDTLAAGLDISWAVKSVIQDELSGWIKTNVPRLVREALQEHDLQSLKPSPAERQNANTSPKPKARKSPARSKTTKSKTAKKAAKKSAAKAAGKTRKTVSRNAAAKATKTKAGKTKT